MENGRFENYDDPDIYAECQKKVLDIASQNFVIEFGRDEAQIAFNLEEDDFNKLLTDPRPQQRPIRWINIWGPHKQEAAVTRIAKHYGFSSRLHAVIRDTPMPRKPKHSEPKSYHFSYHGHNDDDLEKGDLTSEQEKVKERKSVSMQSAAGHYHIVNKMTNYHAIDFGEKFICVGANWMHEQMPEDRKVNLGTDISGKHEEEEEHRRLYSWLVVCNDSTVISFHEHVDDIKNLESARSNLKNVFCQLSVIGMREKSDTPIAMISLRNELSQNGVQDWGSEGASNLFYYLFDDWQTVYQTVERFQDKLQALGKRIFDSSSRKSVKPIQKEIVPQLHKIGYKIRQMQHVYEGYKNLIQRVLQPAKQPGSNGTRTPSSPTSETMQFAPLNGRQGPPLTPSAISRFERLGDRLQLLILSETKELLLEKDALANTYFSINAQKDSEATARLTRAAGLLAKLSVLFLPVSLMTSYFSIQIKDLEGVYSVRDYWYSFAVIMSISFLLLFFLNRALMEE
ncbi:hypothetical protein HYFRA_00012406 [Hymenoscyphus fraxineus]|uniref:Uncharacterized protein n=1 Tax=Hymenoscyphus fraxineus TaxID=746836 RepID=A0A9N9LA54_9HELO|nr:hypothetical protein HYFRA_00012406 [Hymenoscyphus fraxineus]